MVACDSSKYGKELMMIIIMMMMMMIIFMQDDHLSYKNCYQHGSCVK